MVSPDQLVTFTLLGRQLALPLAAVERIVRAVEVTPVPHAPDVVRGVINVQGRILPVLDLRAWFAAPPPELDLSDQLIIAQGATRAVALVAEEVAGLVEAGDASPADDIHPDLAVEGVVKREGDVVLILSVDRLLTGEVETALREVLKGSRPGNGR